jgi:hypothetical protein
LEITIPYNFVPEWYMLEVFQDPHRFQVLNWHRKAKKTTIAINQLIRWAATKKGTYWYIAPSYSNAKRVIWDDPYMLSQYVPDWNNPNSTFIRRKETELKVDFLQSGGSLYVIGADRFDLIRGGNPQGVVLDEFAIMKPEVWDEVIQPVMRSNPSAWCWFLFTPKGKNHAWRLSQLGRTEHPEWKYWELPVTKSGVYTQEQIDFARNDMPTAAFNQELMCEFLEGEGSVFRNIRGAGTATPQTPKHGARYVMGVDLGRLQDFTVIAVYDIESNKQVYQDRFHQIDWGYQKTKIREISRHYNNALVVMDATGLGDPIVDDLLRANVPIKPVTLTSNNKKELIEKLSLYLEQKKIEFIPLEETLFEFDNFGYEMTKTGRVQYGAPSGLHDDIVIAHALAVSELFAKAYIPIEAPRNRIKEAFTKAVQKMQRGENFDTLLSEWENN